MGHAALRCIAFTPARARTHVCANTQVRGYPFSLREGVPTVISHGLWLNIPDYDAPTQVRVPPVVWICNQRQSQSRSESQRQNKSPEYVLGPTLAP